MRSSNLISQILLKHTCKLNRNTTKLTKTTLAMLSTVSTITKSGLATINPKIYRVGCKHNVAQYAGFPVASLMHNLTLIFFPNIFISHLMNEGSVTKVANCWVIEKTNQNCLVSLFLFLSSLNEVCFTVICKVK